MKVAMDVIRIGKDDLVHAHHTHWGEGKTFKTAVKAAMRFAVIPPPTKGGLVTFHIERTD